MTKLESQLIVIVAVLVGLLVLVATCGRAHAETCIASWYGRESGPRTASGERFGAGLTAAHRTHRFGTYVRVTNRHNGRSVEVRINDRGPWVRGRCIDLSPAAARAIGLGGTAPVTVDVVRP
jgi:rare lipoprotein A